MPKVIGIVGYHNSGKTTLACALARALIARGYRVAAVKHLSHYADLPGKDTALLAEAAGQVGFISPEGAGIFWKEPLSLEEVISHLEADIVLVEGFKGQQTFPKIVCLRGQPDDADEADEYIRCIRDLFDEWVIGAVGPAGQVEGIEVPVFGPHEVDKIADLVEREETLAKVAKNLRKGDGTSSNGG
ncbi:MAG TPA: molybdopterin-guanine dinucleotide biosynthesis protein B [Anaerolineae bacterium]|nr:molybdopterin-guanine dinucleotide biosynthesis protein B [Anaerolineae bacterium]